MYSVRNSHFEGSNSVLNFGRGEVRSTNKKLIIDRERANIQKRMLNVIQNMSQYYIYTRAYAQSISEIDDQT